MMKFVICLALVYMAQGLPQKSMKSGNRMIVNGIPAEPNEFPYQVVLLHKDFEICGGSILNENHVLTAAHCLEDLAFRYKIVAGEHDLTKDDGTEQTVAVSRIFIHKGYGRGVGTNANDIAILRLAAPLKFNNAVQPIALPNPGHISTGIVEVTGWGRRSLFGKRYDILQKVSLPIIEDKECEELYERTEDARVNGDIMICAGYVSGGKDSCKGDSGGPLTAYDDGVYLAGVVSWGIGCAFPGFPGVYVEVAQYIDWIHNIIQ